MKDTDKKFSCVVIEEDGRAYESWWKGKPKNSEYPFQVHFSDKSGGIEDLTFLVQPGDEENKVIQHLVRRLSARRGVEIPPFGSYIKPVCGSVVLVGRDKKGYRSISRRLLDFILSLLAEDKNCEVECLS